MSFWTLVLVVIGIVSIAVSCPQLKRPPSSKDFAAVNAKMTDARIASQLNQQPSRVDAKLGIQFGFALIGLGLLWQVIVSLAWL